MQGKKKMKSVCNLIRRKSNKLYYQCKECKKGQLKPISGFIKKFPNIYQFCNGNINKFVSLLRKGVYTYKYMESWERFDETILPNKKAFYSELKIKDITHKNYVHAQKVFEEFKLKNLSDYHDLYVITLVIHYYLQMCLKTLETSVLKYMNLILLIFCQLQDQHGKLV